MSGLEEHRFDYTELLFHGEKEDHEALSQTIRKVCEKLGVQKSWAAGAAGARATGPARSTRPGASATCSASD